jgi:exonuclease SbcC
MAKRIKEGDAEAERFRRALTWYDKRKALESLIAQASEAVTKSITASEATSERRLILKNVESAFALRPLYDRSIRTKSHWEEIKRRVADQSAVMSLADANKARSYEALVTSDKTLKAELTEAQTLKPTLDVARSLDTRIKADEERLTSVTLEASHSSDEEHLAIQNRDASITEKEKLQADLIELDKSLEGYNAIQSLLPMVPRFNADIKECVEVNRSLVKAEKALQASRQEAKANRASFLLVSKEKKALLANTENSQRKLEALNRDISHEPREALAKTREQAQKNADQARTAEAILSRLAPAVQQRMDAESHARAAIVSKSQASEKESGAIRDLGLKKAALIVAQNSLDKARDASTLDEMRHRLVADEPCQLCGSKDHPWALSSPMPGLVETLLLQKNQLEGERDQLEAIRAEAQSQGREADVKLNKASEEKADSEQIIHLESAAYIALIPTLKDLPEDYFSPQTYSFISEKINEFGIQLAGIAVRESALRELEVSAELLRMELQGSQEKLLELESRLTQSSEQRHTLEMDLTKIASEMSSWKKRLIQLKDSLVPVFNALSEGETLFISDPEMLRTRLSEEAERCHSMLESRKVLTDKLSELDANISVLRATADSKAVIAENVTQRLKIVQGSLAKLHSQRLGYWDGKSVAEIEEELAQHSDSARFEFEEATRTYQSADKAFGEAKSTLNALSEQLENARIDALDAQEDIAEALVKKGWEKAELQSLLEWTPDSIIKERQTLQEIDDQCMRDKAVLDAHRKEMAEHEAIPAPDLLCEELETQSLRLNTELDEKKIALGGINVELRKDDEARLRAQTIEGDMKEQDNRTILWREMNDLIGSSDGKKFRAFAQSLTLEALVEYANEHLVRLGPRYLLQRVPGYDLELQVVDRDMGDEIRALNGLSGGETFLVSLALALGLSSLSSSETPIDSLFIDEGFGTLDSETLETALSVLDELQSQGRQVGIISHVEGLDAHIPVQIRLEKIGGGASKVSLPS